MDKNNLSHKLGGNNLICSEYARVIELKDKILVYNAFLGGLIVFSREICKYLKIENNKLIYIESNIPPEILERLKKKNILYISRDYEINQFNNRFDILNSKAKCGQLIKSLRLTLTKKCNCSCSYCYVEKTSDGLKSLTFSDCVKFIDASIELTQVKNMKIRFFGGEPTLEFELIKNVIEYIENKHTDIKFEYILNTNAQGITNEMVNYFVKKNFKTVVSLDSIKTNNDYNRRSLINNSYYDEAIKQIRIFSEKGLNFVINAVVTNSSLNDLMQFVMEMHAIGVKRISINLAKMVDEDTMSFSKDIAKNLLDVYKFCLLNKLSLSGNWLEPFKRIINGGGQAFCGGIGHELDLRPDRKIYSCNGESEPLTDLNSISTIPYNPKYIKIANRVPGNISSCKDCEIEGLCAGECASDARVSNNNYFEGNIKLCDLFKEILYLILDYTIS